MPKIVYEDGTEEEVTLIGGGRECGGKEYFKYTKVDRSRETLRNDLVIEMQSRQVSNLLPSEIVEGMLLLMGIHEFADDLSNVLYDAYKLEHRDNPVPNLNNMMYKFLKKWGLRN